MSKSPQQPDIKALLGALITYVEKLPLINYVEKPPASCYKSLPGRL